MSKKIFYFLFFLPLFLFGLNKYDMELGIDFSKKIIIGKTILNFTNTYNFPIKYFYFNLYQNGFQEGSTLFKESNYFDIYKKKFKDEAYSSTEIKYISVGEKKLEYRFISPDDGNSKDKTLLEVVLPMTLFPEEPITLEISWETKLHKYYFRSGYTDESLFLMQWYPKLAVFEGGKWRTHQFHPSTEFYGEFSDFEINFLIPLEWDLVGTGKIEEEKVPQGKKIKITAENVHDVGIVISKELKKIKKNINIPQDNPIEVSIFIPTEYNYKIPRILDILVKSFDFCNEWIGPYLYSNFSIVFPPWEASQGRAGMEYPQLILCGIKHFQPVNSLELEYVIAHEFAHQYFYGLLGSNEVDEPWLDEGFTTYISSKYLEKYFPLYKIDLPLFLKFNVLKPMEMNPFDAINLNYYNDDGIAQFSMPGFQHPDYKRYRIYAYNKPAMALKTLEKYFGEEYMKKFLQDYFSSYSFLHPHTDDVISLIEKNFGIAWAQNFYNLSYRPQIIDYEIEIITDKQFIVKKYGDLYIPLEIKVFFKDGTSENINIENIKSFQIFKFEEKSIKKVILDPERKILLDLNPLNNIAKNENKGNPFFYFFFSKINLFFESLICLF